MPARAGTTGVALAMALAVELSNASDQLFKHLKYDNFTKKV